MVSHILWMERYIRKPFEKSWLVFFSIVLRQSFCFSGRFSDLLQYTILGQMLWRHANFDCLLVVFCLWLRCLKCPSLSTDGASKENAHALCRVLVKYFGLFWAHHFPAKTCIKEIFVTREMLSEMPISVYLPMVLWLNSGHTIPLQKTCGKKCFWYKWCSVRSPSLLSAADGGYGWCQHACAKQEMLMKTCLC